MHTLYLGLGANLGDREATLRKAIAALADEVGAVERVSSFYTTRPWGFRSDNDFVNCCVRMATALSPRQVLEATQDIERRLGRTAKSHDGHYADRVVDIDILLYDDLHLDEPDLRIPHPLMTRRDFVMRPLSEIMDGAPGTADGRGGGAEA